MTPVHEMLNRIRWDPEFAQGDFVLGYFDRVAGRIVQVPFQAVEFPKGDRRVFRLVDPEGGFQRVPFHRVREIYKNGQRIWQRP